MIDGETVWRRGKTGLYIISTYNMILHILHWHSCWSFRSELWLPFLLAWQGYRARKTCGAEKTWNVQFLRIGPQTYYMYRYKFIQHHKRSQDPKQRAKTWELEIHVAFILLKVTFWCSSQPSSKNPITANYPRCRFQNKLNSREMTFLGPKRSANQWSSSNETKLPAEITQEICVKRDDLTSDTSS